MPESTLTLTRNDVFGKVCLFLGYSRGPAFGVQPPQGTGEPALTQRQLDIVNDVIDSGYRRVLHPVIPELGIDGYAWSWLHPSTKLTIDASATTVQLPDDFGGIEGTITVPGTQGRPLWEVRIENVGAIDSYFMRWPTRVGKPEAAAIRIKRDTAPNASTRSELYVFPETDASYTLAFSYYVNPNANSSAFPYFLGGMGMAEVILESCLAVAEERWDDASSVHAQAFVTRLAAAISQDRRQKAQVLGYNRDASDDGSWAGANPFFDHLNSTITYNGVAY